MKNHQNKNYNFISRMFNLSTIKAKFLVPISLTLITLFTLLDVGFIQYFNSKAKIKLNNDIKIITALETRLLDVPVWNYNEEHIKEVVKYPFKNKEVVYIKVYDDEKGTDLLAGYTRDKEWGIKTWNDDSIIYDPYLIIQKATINRIVDGKNKIIGLVEIGFTGKFYQKEKITTVLFIMLFGFFVLALVIGLLIAIIKVITNPIQRLTDIVVGSSVDVYDKTMLSKIIASSDQLEQAEIYSKDETGQLAFAFTVMIKQLRESLESQERETTERKHAEELLQKAYDQQEIRIQERTSKLSEANQELEIEINERKLAEEALRASEKDYRSTLSDLLVGVVVHAGDTSILLSNPEAENILGLTNEQMAGKKTIDPEWNFVDENSTIMKVEEYPVSKVFSTKKPLHDYVVGINRPDRDYVTWAIVNATPAFSNDGELEKVVVNFIDITARKQAEEEKDKLETQLRQSHKMESVGTLAGGIAHDFNNMLGIIVGNTELAMDDVPEWNPARQNLEEIRTASMRARDVVKQILAFSRRSLQEMKPVRISPIIKESLKLLRSSFPTTIEIHQDISNEPDTVRADPTQINQVLINLCTNAAHAMGEKGGVLEVSLKNIEMDEGSAIHYHDLSPGKYVRLTVSDTGHGIEPKIIERIFDPYFTTKGVGEGSGMGLSVVHGIVKSHSGDISVSSEPGKGTTFQIFFPCTENKPEPEIEITVEIPRGKERILFVDDEKAMVDAIQPMIERLGYKVTARTSSIEALEAFRANPDRFDLVITDFTMPNMTGMELAKELLKLRPDIPIMLCTGYSEHINEDKAKGAGIRAFVMKPVVLGEIANTIRKVLDND